MVRSPYLLIGFCLLGCSSTFVTGYRSSLALAFPQYRPPSLAQLDTDTSKPYDDDSDSAANFLEASGDEIKAAETKVEAETADEKRDTLPEADDRSEDEVDETEAEPRKEPAKKTPVEPEDEREVAPPEAPEADTKEVKKKPKPVARKHKEEDEDEEDEEDDDEKSSVGSKLANIGKSLAGSLGIKALQKVTDSSKPSSSRLRQTQQSYARPAAGRATPAVKRSVQPNVVPRQGLPVWGILLIVLGCIGIVALLGWFWFYSKSKNVSQPRIGGGVPMPVA